MILSIMYMYFAGTGEIEFSPYWLAACAICDAIVLGQVANVVHGAQEPLFNLEMK